MDKEVVLSYWFESGFIYRYTNDIDIGHLEKEPAQTGELVSQTAQFGFVLKFLTNRSKHMPLENNWKFRVLQIKKKMGTSVHTNDKYCGVPALKYKDALLIHFTL